MCPEAGWHDSPGRQRACTVSARRRAERVLQEFYVKLSGDRSRHQPDFGRFGQTPEGTANRSLSSSEPCWLSSSGANDIGSSAVHDRRGNSNSRNGNHRSRSSSRHRNMGQKGMALSKSRDRGESVFAENSANTHAVSRERERRHCRPSLQPADLAERNCLQAPRRHLPRRTPSE